MTVEEILEFVRMGKLTIEEAKERILDLQIIKENLYDRESAKAEETFHNALSIL